MGCFSGTGLSENQLKSDNKMIILEKQELNIIFKEAELCLKEIEIFKQNIINIRVEIIYDTGACLLKNLILKV